MRVRSSLNRVVLFRIHFGVILSDSAACIPSFCQVPWFFFPRLCALTDVTARSVELLFPCRVLNLSV